MQPVVGTPVARPLNTRNNIPTETIDMFTIEQAPNGTLGNYDNDDVRANNASIYQLQYVYDADNMPQHRRLKQKNVTTGTEVCTHFATSTHNIKVMATITLFAW